MTPVSWSGGVRKLVGFPRFDSGALAKALNGDSVTALLNAPLAAAKMPEDLQRDLLVPLPEAVRFESLTAVQIREEAQANFYGVPLCDTGPTRTYAWSALGIQWRVSCSNAFETVCQVEQFVAVLQIALADLASRELCLLPTKVTIEVELRAVNRPKLKMVPGNDASAMKVILPSQGPATPAQLEELQQGTCAIALAVLTQCSCLSDKDVIKALENAFRNGLTSKVFIVRPYSELFSEFTDSAEFASRRAKPLGPPDGEAYAIRSAPELEWRDSRGPGYTAERSRIALTNRYERGIKPIARTLARLRGSPRFREWVAGHRAQGRKDWWILLVLMNTVTNYRARHAVAPTDPQALREYMMRAINEDEPVDAIEFPEEVLFGDEAKMAATSFMLSTARVWHLAVRAQTPDLQAFERVLNVRFGQATDDIEHVDPFASLDASELREASARAGSS